MRFVIVTGMSGAGKSTALKMLEDVGYFCVDNLPISLIEKFAQLTMDGTEGKIKKVAISTYIITPYNVDILGDLIDELENNGLYF